nr:ABC transporter ATP-binding protein/permease [Treponema sp.]
VMVSLIDQGIVNHDFDLVLKKGLLIVGMSLLSLLCGSLGSFFGAASSQGFSKNLRKKLFRKVQGFSFKNTDHFQVSSIITRLTTDVTNAQNVYRQLIQFSFRAPIMLLAGTIMAFRLNIKLALVFLISIPLLASFIAFVSVKAYPRFAKMLEKYDGLNTIVQENLIGIRVVKSFVRREHENQKFDQMAFSLKEAHEKAEKLVILNMPVMLFVMYATTISIFWFGGKMVVFGNMSSGELISFLSYVVQILTSLMMVGMIFITMVLSRASLNRIVEILDEEEDIKSPDSSISVKSIPSFDIDFENVTFSYTDKLSNSVLTDISFHIPQGSMVGLIGGTGSSKTTLVSLIDRLYDVQKGAVKIGGIDVRSYDLDILRKAVGIVLKKNVLFSGTIKENLLWGNEKAGDEEIQNACIASDADSFIQGFAEKYDYMLTQGGSNLSGGQKQRLCIARTLLKKPGILILDDSTSAVDTTTEKNIQNHLRKLYPETTKIIIAQRLSSVRDLDFIIVLDNGKISGIGSHQELLKNNKIYQEVLKSQASAGDADI